MYFDLRIFTKQTKGMSLNGGPLDPLNFSLQNMNEKALHDIFHMTGIIL